jgi:hypothetical protein
MLLSITNGSLHLHELIRVYVALMNYALRQHKCHPLRRAYQQSQICVIRVLRDIQNNLSGKLKDRAGGDIELVDIRNTSGGLM